MKNTKRGLSIFLVLALFVTSVGIGFGTGGLKSAVPVAETVSKTTVDNYAIHFYVPETIYLTPATGTASTFKYYVDSSNSTTPTLDTSKAKTSGNLYFYSANATNVKIECSGATITGTTPAMNTVVSGGTISTAITGGTLSTAIAQKATSTLTWTATYTVGGQTMTAKAYTVCYAPPVEAIGVNNRMKNDDGSAGYNHDLQGLFYVSGVHGYGNNSDGKAGIKSFNQTTGNMVCPMLGNVTNPNGAASQLADWHTGTTGGIYYGEETGGQDQISMVKISPTGLLTVDTSRYTDINQIPNYTCGMVIYNVWQANQLNYYICDYDDGTTFLTEARYNDNVNQNNIFRDNGATGSQILFGSATTNQTVTTSIVYGGTTGGNVYSNAISGTGTYAMRLKGACWDKSDDNEWLCFANLVNVTVTKVSKGTLRNNIRYYTNLGLQAADYSNDAADFTAFTNELAAAAVRLGTVTGSDASDTLATKYAALTKNSYTATINHQFNNGKTTITETQTYNSGDTVDFAANSYTGYTLASATGETTATTAQTIVNRRTAITQNYNYTANTYTVAYNGNGSTSGSTASSSHTYDVDKNLTSNGFAKTGYQFAGWATSAGGAVAYSDGVSVKNLSATQGATVTLYAKWTPNTYAVTYSGNGNTSGSIPGNSSHTYDDASNTLQSNSGNLAKTGFTFGGWSLNADGSGTTYTAPQTGVFNFSATQGATVTLYAKWTGPNAYTVTFDGNGGGTPSPTSKQVTYGTQYGSLATVSRTGYTFTGWYDAASGGNKIETTTTDNTGAAHTLYAHWSGPNNFNVTFKANTGSGSDYTQSITFGGSANLTANTFTKTGYTFAGWNTVANGIGGTAYAAGGSLTMDTEGKTLYAQWTINSYTITWVANGGTGGGTNSCDHFATPTPVSEGTRAGYTFDGWSPTIVAATGPATYTAQWTMNQSAIDGITVALTENPTDMTVTVENAVEGCKYQIWSYQRITSDDLLDLTPNVKANQWILSKAYDASGQAVGTLSYTIDKFTSPNNNYTIAVRIIDGSGAYVREIRDSFTKTEIGTAQISKVFVDDEYARGSSQEDRDNNIKSAAVIREIKTNAAPVIQIIGNLSGMTYTATVVETGAVLTASGNEFTWDISGLVPRGYTVRVTASKDATTDTWDIPFVLYMSETPSVPYGVLSNMSLTGGTPYSAPQNINIYANFANGYFYYTVGEAGRSPIATSSQYTATGNIGHTIDQYGVYRILGYANRSVISPSGRYFDDGNAQTIEIKRAAGTTTTTLTANVNLNNPVNKGTAIVFDSTATIAGIGTTDVEYSYWRQDAGGYVLVKDWSLDSTLAWTPGRVGNYKIEVRAKGVDAGSYEAINSVWVNVVSTEQIAKNVVFTINKTELNSAQPWTPIVVKVSATSDSADLLYKFNVQEPMFDAVTKQNYSANQEFVWTPKKAGDYKISVLVKNQDSFGQFDAIEQFTVTVQ